MLLPLAEILREAYPEVLQPWYADDAGMQGPPDQVTACFKLLCEIGPPFGYFPDPDKSYAICPLASEEDVKATFLAQGLKVKTCRGHRYVGGYAGLLAMCNRWIEPQVEQWVANIGVLAKIASKYPQSAYHSFVTSLQAELQYLCRTTTGVGEHMGPVEDGVRDVMIPAMLQLKPSEVTDDLRTLLSHGVKQGGINFRNPVEGADAIFASS